MPLFGEAEFKQDHLSAECSFSLVHCFVRGPWPIVVEDRLRRKQLQIKPFPKTHSELIIIVVSSRNSSQELNIISLYHQQCSGANCKSKGLYSYFQTEAQHLAAMKYDVHGDLGQEAAKRFHLGLLCLCFHVLCLSSLQVRRS